jgi:lysophospholipase L1-like esterase
MARSPRSSARFWLWTFPVIAGTCAAIVLGAGFVLALRGAIGEPIGEPPPPPVQPKPQPRRNGERRILVIGDSLARGTGDETGKGFAVDVLQAYRRRGPAELTNLGVNGSESPEIRTLAESATVRARAAEADLILVSAGANDLSHAASAIGGEASATGLADAVSAARDRYVENLRGILRALREANPTAPILLVGLYDPFSGQAGPGRLGSSVIVQWNALAAETALAFPNVAVVPTFDIFQGRTERLAADRYHPNREGYRRIAERMLQLESGS